eukprot:GHVU01060503.1.p1 GENE.GHVU01060503.1~~GHVU01060503.1.p1  ORF type:complete len:227 (-),score=45.91 GHVU01060503.1:804-1484(-)
MAGSVDKQKQTVTKDIIMGTYSYMLPASIAAANNTHRWTCIVRAPDCENQSYFIKKVVFHLHHSFEQSILTVDRPPYQVSESGWGEFHIKAQVYFVDETEKPVELLHFLRLYPPGTTDVSAVAALPDRERSCVATETYDQLLFTDPKPGFKEKLIHGSPNPPVEYDQEENFLRHDESDQVARIKEEHAKVQLACGQFAFDIQKLKEEVCRLRSEAIQEAERGPGYS